MNTVAPCPVEAFLAYESLVKAIMGMSVRRFEDWYYSGQLDNYRHSEAERIATRLCRKPTPEEWTDWFSRKYDRPRCTERPEHLVGSAAHRWTCLVVE